MITAAGIALTITHYELCFLQNSQKRNVDTGNVVLLTLSMAFISWISLVLAAIIETYVSHI
ncbi:hypothetical protein BLIJ_0489 [Bifidobacterium longum subsp. infantis ATCC 15697 = JCM 1222 = DSM 20088]|nr:hypothetical protein BLIJ_0489 [Bifidobacterium longum subsp. infantis ATCC 15697 = JCM 1222 = DSM 20088]